MRLTRFALLLPLIAGLGCATEPNDILVGKWGGIGLGLTASQHLVTLRMPCGSGTVTGPIAVNEDGGFEFETTVHEFYGDYEMYVEGVASGGRVLEVEIGTEYDRPGSQLFVLVRGVAPDFTDFVCLGAAR
jgi:hypothetical protein